MASSRESFTFNFFTFVALIHLSDREVDIYNEEDGLFSSVQFCSELLQIHVQNT